MSKLLPFVLLLIHWSQTAPLSEEARIEQFENYFNEIYVEDEDLEVKNRNALQSPLQRWPGRTLYYKISPDYTPEETANVHAAVAVFSEKTCLVFVEYDAATDKNRRYIHYKKSPNMCGTKVGYNPMTPTGPHDVVLNPYCLSQVAVIEHETMHVLGLYHEQSRPDRNQYVEIVYDNIPQKYWSQFGAYPPIYTTTYNVPYDYESLMHYSQYAFAKDPTKPTMRARDGNKVYDRNMGQLNGPSEGDLIKINIMYKCN